MGRSLDDVSDQSGFTRPKPVIREHYGLGSQLSFVSMDAKIEPHDSPADSPLFTSLTLPVELCEAKNGWACENCPSRLPCLRLFDKITDLDSKGKLDANTARMFIERFNRIKKD